jgi:hypothetical protein
MNAKEAAIHWRTLARYYHSLGFNIVPLGNDKRPVVVGVGKTGGVLRFRWEDWESTKQEGRLFDALLEPAWWADVRGIAAISGPISGNLVCFDFDHCPEETLQGFMQKFSLPADYPWTVKTPGNGFHLWLRTQEPLDIPKGKERRPVAEVDGAFVELRWTGHYTALPGSHHPSGGVYEWLNEEPEQGAQPWIL